MLEGRIEQGVLTWRVDNNAALAAIRNQGSTRSWGLSWMAVQILKDAERQGVIIDPVRVSSEENNLADAASRFKEVPDWSLKPDIVNKMFIRWGKADVDLMATTESRKAPFFYGWRSCDTEALALDSLARDVDWSGWENPYCFPPFSLVGAVLQKCCEQRLKRMILVVPWWPSKAFFGNLQAMLLDYRRIRVTKDLVLDLTSGEAPPDLKKCRLVACTVSGRLAREQGPGSLKTRGSSSKQVGAAPLRNNMDPAGGGGLGTAEQLEYLNIPLL